MFDQSSRFTLDNHSNAFVVVDNLGSLEVHKYTPGGAIPWTRTYSLAHKALLPQAIAADSKGSVVVVGSMTDTTTGHVNGIALKYTAEGKLLWERQLMGPANDVKVDSQLRTVIPGQWADQLLDPYYQTSFLYSGATVTTERTGARLSVQLDTHDNAIFLSHEAALNGNTLYKYSPTGELIWVRGVSKLGSNTYVNKVIVGPGDSIYLGVIVTPVSFGAIRLSRDGNLLWSKVIGPDLIGHSNGVNLDMAVASNGQCVLVGATSLILNNAWPHITVGLSPTGSLLYSRYSGWDIYWATPISMALDDNLTSYTAGFGTVVGQAPYQAEIHAVPFGGTSEQSVTFTADGTYFQQIAVKQFSFHPPLAGPAQVEVYLLTQNTFGNGTQTYLVKYIQSIFAVADSFALTKNGHLQVGAPGVFANDRNAEGASAQLGTNVKHGALTLNPDGSFNYTPQAGYVGDDSFTYTAVLGPITSNETTVSIKVAAQ